jgi:hypothetical protein
MSGRRGGSDGGFRGTRWIDELRTSVAAVSGRPASIPKPVESVAPSPAEPVPRSSYFDPTPPERCHACGIVVRGDWAFYIDGQYDGRPLCITCGRVEIYRRAGLRFVYRPKTDRAPSPVVPSEPSR